MIDIFRGIGDTHCHLHAKQFQSNRDQIVQNALDGDLKFIVDVAIDIESAREIGEYAKQYPDFIYPTIGVHPEIAVPGSDLWDEGISEEVIDKMIVSITSSLNSPESNFMMIGECGLDYYWLKKNELSDEKVEQSKKLQLYLFERQVELAAEFNLPLTIHSRDALKDCLEIISRYSGRVNGIFHSFTYGYKNAKRILDQGFGIGINGIATYQNSDLRDVVKKVMGEGEFTIEDYYQKGIFFETDAPYLTPEKYRGQVNQPRFVQDTLEYIRLG